MSDVVTLTLGGGGGIHREVLLMIMLRLIHPMWDGRESLMGIIRRRQRWRIQSATPCQWRWWLARPTLSDIASLLLMEARVMVMTGT